MEKEEMYFGDDFGQKIDLTVRIREILRNYPEGISIFKEMVQNADDAGATEVNFCLDRRQHGIEKLAYRKMEVFQGPSLLVHNNAIFTDVDFESIQRIGDSLKKDNSKGWKTGRFGIGFNSVYHLTDLPTFVSGSQLVLFDPQACHLPNVNPSNPGKMIDFISHSELVANFPDQFEPFKWMGCDFSQPFNGTIFRLSLRSEDQAGKSKLNTHPRSPDGLREMLTEFASDLSLVLLFLRNIAKIGIYEWKENAPAPIRLYETKVGNMTHELELKRALKATNISSIHSASSFFSVLGEPCDYLLEIMSENLKGGSNLSTTVKYMVCNQLGGGDATKIANDPAHQSLRLVPWGGVAVMVESSNGKGLETGLAFCFLPLPTHNFLPIHVNGYFELSSNRRDIWYGDGLSGDGLLRAKWNASLLKDVIAPCYSRAIINLARDKQINPNNHAQLFPQNIPPAPWDILAVSFFQLIQTQVCLYSAVHGGKWISPEECILLKRGIPQYEDLSRYLLKDGLPVVDNLSEDLEKALVKTKAVPQGYFLPSKLREIYKSVESIHAGDKEAIRVIVDFATSDLNTKNPEDIRHLIAVRLLPLANGSLTRFEQLSNINLESLDYLCSMGFTRSHATCALNTVGSDVEAALNWLFQNPNPSMKRSTDIYFLPSNKELILLARARNRLIDVDALSSSSLQLLRSSTLQAALNVKTLDFDSFQDLLSYVFPPQWYGQQSVQWDHNTSSSIENGIEWYRLLWEHIGPSEYLRIFQDKWPIVPTSVGVACTLSTMNGVVSVELIAPECLLCLQKLGVRVLLPGLFSTFHPHSDVWSYIQQPTPAGVLSGIGAVLTKGSTPLNIRRIFKSVSVTERISLRDFLLSGVFSEFTNEQQRVLKSLPIFYGVKPIAERDETDITWSSETLQDNNSISVGIVPVFVSIDTLSHPVYMCRDVSWELLDKHFIYIGDAKRTEGSVLFDLLVSLGVRKLSKVEFFCRHLIPRLSTENMTLSLRIRFVREMLNDVSHVLSEDADGSVIYTLESLPIFPSMTGEIRSITDLYDPEVEELEDIMDGSFLPAIELQEPTCLAALRSLGLQRSLTRRSILALALVIENEQGKILSMIQSKGETQQESNQKVANLRKRAMDFFRYVDSHMDHLVNINSSKKPRRFRKRIKSKGMKFLRSIIGDEIKSIQDEDNGHGQVQVMEENEQLLLEKEEIQDFKSKLAIISWVPVCVKPPDANLPWSVNIEDASQCAIVVASPQNTRPAKFGWLCSAQFRILEGVAYSDELRSCCGWEDTLPASIVASQLKSMVEKYLERPPESHGSNTNTQTLWTAVFEIYKLLSRFFEMETDMNKVEEVLSCLGGNIPLVWVGKKFVSAHQVASISQINAEPYLYTIPSELIHFRPFLKAIGVRDKFSVGDYLQVLEVLYRTHRDPLQTEEDEGIENRSIPLSEDALMKSISIIQLASDMMTHHSDWEIFAPDVNGRVLHASKLTYDDAPWIDKHSSELSSEMKSLRFLHPKLSNEVAGKIGAKSLRAKLLLANSGNETISFGVESSEMEAFGQTEALTRRISHILEQYPDGPNVFNELIQNADDAGATKVSILYHGGTFGTSSLLSPSMAKWQGPALYCFNDAEFKENDFISLARIGQGNKLQRANTTGRFGLGFNAVYHYTDLPTIVSANSIVMFDPHACFLPGITPSNPGIKIRFLNSTIVNQFPDQFKPLEMFGCDLKNHFHGTLFRFPLRNESTAGTSEIKRIAYSEKDIGLLLKSFKTIITSTILFLRNVRQVEVYVQLNDCTSPILLFGAEVPSEDRGESWQSIEKFMKGDNPNTSESKNNKRAFYAKLRSTPQEKLPSVIQTLHIRGYEHQSCDHIIRGLKADSLVSSLPNESADSSLKEFVEKYLVCSQIGGGKAREIACAPENESLKLIPWVGIAARFDTNSTLLQQETEGRAFCFLPLPVRTGLPVHINGYFELSSNRRDIWHGEDMTGEGKLRSEWNRYLLSDAVAPAYLNFLLEAKRILLERSLGDDYGKAKYFSLFPSSLPSSPWNHVVSSLFSSMRSRSMFWDISTPANHEESKEASEQSYVSFSPEKTVLIDDKVSTWKTLKQAIETTEFHTINVHTPLRNLFVDLNATHAIMSPHFFRELMRTKRDNFLSSIDESLLKHVIAYSFEDCKDLATLTNEMDGLNIVPTMDGSFATLRVLSASTSSGDNIGAEYFFCKNSIEEELLLMLDGSSCRSRIIKSEFKSIFESLPGEFFALFNVKIMNYLTMCSFLKLILPHKWQLKTQEEGSVNGLVQWLPGDDPSHPSKEWVETWWRYSEMELSQKSINPGHLPIDALAGWPLIPTLRNDVLHLARLRSEIPLFVHEPDTKTSLDILQEMLGLLNKLGMQVIDCSFVCGEETVSWLLKSGLANALNSNGVLKSLELLALDTEQSLRRENPKKQFQYPLDALFDEVSESEKQALLNFLVANERSAIDDIFIEVLKELPIFPVYNLDKSQYKRYVCLNRGGGIIPSTDADERALDEHFFLIKNDNTRKFLCDMGIPEWNFTTILLEYVFPNLVKYEEVSSELVDGIVMDALIALPFHQRNDARFKDFVRSNAICPSQRRQMRRISDLHDPNIKELVALVGINALPAETLMKQDMTIDILRSLGLRTSLSAHGILESARAVETLLCENPEDARTKSYSLVSIVNKCFDQLLEEMSNQTDAIEIIETLKKIKWLPVHSKPLKPLMPWKKQDPNPHILIASAIDTRPQKDAWLCSSMKFVLDGELQSDRLIQAFGWCEDISSETLAYQLVAIAEEVNQNGQLNETDISIGDRNTQSLKAVIHQVQEIYERLDQSRAEQQHTEDESTTKEDTHDSSGDRDFASVQKILAGLPWIWTGKEFVTTSRIAFEADPALEPLLFVAPPELLIPKYLLLAFQVKDSFDSNDYLMALSLLPKDIQLEASQVKACLKVFEHLSQTLKEDQNQGQLSVMLLDTSNTLVPASSLVYDDMQWNESAEIRRGCRFIHKNISREVALTLGACSLHSRLADASSSSIRLRCPSKTTLGSLLPSIEETERNVWQKYFISELLNAIEWQMKAKFFDMVIDYRRHPCQRVIRPSFQTLQNDALCIHIPELVLSTEDIYALLNSSQNTNKAGILAGFYFADCLQILSGDGFYVIDPSGNFLNDQEQVISPTEEGLARRYDVLAQDFARYADQLLPFSALPCCEGNMNNGTRSTILRYCFRREVNLSFSIKNFAILDSKIDKFVSFIKKDVLPTALVFSETLQRISIWSVGKDSEFAIHLHGECHLQNAVSILKKRISTRQNVEWKKKFSLQSFFKTSVVPSTTMEFDIKMEIENKRWIDTWLFVDNIGAGRTRDLAGSAVHEILLNVIPYIAIACHLQRDGKLVETGYATSRSTRQGRLFQGAVDLFETTGLPIHINGGFELERKQWGSISQRQIVAGRRVPNSTEQTQAKSQDEVANDMRAHWNRVLVEDGVIEAYVQLLNLAKKRCEQINPKALYRFWPTLSTKKASDIGNMVQTLMYRHLGAKDLFLCTDGTFRSLNGGYFLNLEGMHLQVASFAQLHFPSFHLPSQVRHDCGRLLTSQNFRMHWLTPRVMRKFLRTINVNTIHSGICLPLFEYCLSDLQCPLPAENSGIWLEFQSLPILPLANGSTGLIRLNQKNKYYLGSFNHHQLLPTLASQFISLEARKRLGRFFADRTFCNVLSFTSFSIKTLSDHIESMLPASWKNQLYVEWNSSHDHQSNVKFSRIWLCRFWKEVRFDRRSLAYFSTWPLIPVKSMNHGDQDDVIQLVSCGKPEAALCIWAGAIDLELKNALELEYAAADSKNNDELEELDRENTRMIDLSLSKLQKQQFMEDDSDEEKSRVEMDEDPDTEDEGIDGKIEQKQVKSSSLKTSEQVLSQENTMMKENMIQQETAVNTSDIILDSLNQENVLGDGFHLNPSAHNNTVQVAATHDLSINYENMERIQQIDDQQEQEQQQGYVQENDLQQEFIGREKLFEVLNKMNVLMIELAFFSGQERDMVSSNEEVAMVTLDALSTTNHLLAWRSLEEEDARILTEFFAHHSDTYGGFNRMQLDRLKKLPIYINTCNVPCAIDGGQFFLVPPEINLSSIPLPPNARQHFLKLNPRLLSLYRELGVEEMSDAKLLVYLLPTYTQLEANQRKLILDLIKQKWSSLRGDATVIDILRSTPLFPGIDGNYLCANDLFDPRNKVLAKMYDAELNHFPCNEYAEEEWLEIMSHFGLKNDLTVDMFIECASRIETKFGNKFNLEASDEAQIMCLHQFFIQNIEKYERSRKFFDQITQLKFVPAIQYRYDFSNQVFCETILVKYSDASLPEDQCLVFTTRPLLMGSAVPPRILWSRLGIQSPPEKQFIFNHLTKLTLKIPKVLENWYFIMSPIEVFQQIFNFLQTNWISLSFEEKNFLKNISIVPVGSTFVKVNRLFFHLSQNLAPLLFEIPRAFGAYDTLFRHLGSKENPTMEDYIHLLEEIQEECHSNRLNLNELNAVVKIVMSLTCLMVETNQKLDKETKKYLYLPSQDSILRPLVQMAFNDAPWISNRIDLTEIHLIHSRISDTCCHLLDVPRISSIVYEELHPDFPLVEENEDGLLTLGMSGKEILQVNSLLNSKEFAQALKKIISSQELKCTDNGSGNSNVHGGNGNDRNGLLGDTMLDQENGQWLANFEKLDQQIMELGSFQVKAVEAIQSRFFARLDLHHHPSSSRVVEVTKMSTSKDSMYFIDLNRRIIFIARKKIESMPGIRVTQTLACCINQLLGGKIQDLSVLESILSCHTEEMPHVLQLLNVEDNPELVMERLRGIPGEIVSEKDQEMIELAPMRSFLTGEIIAVEQEGYLRYAKIMHQEMTSCGINRVELKLNKDHIEWVSATRIYAFRSSRRSNTQEEKKNSHNTVGQAADFFTTPPSASSSSEMNARVALIAQESVTIKTTTAVSSLTLENSSSSFSFSPPVKDIQLIDAVNDILSRMNLSLSSTYEELITENIRLQKRLEQVEEARRVAISQIDEAMQEKKDALDSLVCAICLEHNVDRVLIPCGHIFCSDCVHKFPRPTCPICRQEITNSSLFHLPS